MNNSPRIVPVLSPACKKVYRGSMMGLPVAVKKLDETGLQGREQFFREVEVSFIGRRHGRRVKEDEDKEGWIQTWLECYGGGREAKGGGGVGVVGWKMVDMVSRGREYCYLQCDRV